MRDNLVKHLRNAAEKWKQQHQNVPTFETRYDLALQEAADAIEDLEKKLMVAEDESGLYDELPLVDQRCYWIPVTKQLPMARKKVLVAYRNGVTIAERDGYVIDPTEMRHYWRGIHGPKRSLHSVTHWMPLPEPPKEVQE